MKNIIKNCPWCGQEPEAFLDDDIVVYGCVNSECVCFDMPLLSENAWNNRPEEERLQKRIDFLNAKIAEFAITINKLMAQIYCVVKDID